MISKLIVVGVILFSITARAELGYKYLFQYRSVPSATNILGTVTYDNLLWGNVDKKNPLYGYYRIGATLGGSPTAAVFAEVAPIAPVILKLQKSTTYRFTKSQTFDCQSIYCYGVLERSDFSTTLAAGHGNIVGFLSYLWRDLRLPSSANPVLAEQELFSASSGNHIYNEAVLTLAYLLENKDAVGILYTAGKFSEGDRKSNSIYGVYRFQWQELDLVGGIGSYQSDQAYVGGNGIIFSVGKKFGESLSLF